jgi:hypothetical protein
MRKTRCALWLSAAFLLGGCAGDFSLKQLFFVEVEAERMCKKFKDMEIPAMQIDQQDLSWVVPFPVPEQAQGDAVGQISFQFTEVTLEADDNTRLDAIESASVTVRTQGSTEPGEAKELLSFRREPGSNGQPIHLRGQEVDLSSLADSPKELFLQAKGDLPREDWKLNVEACWAVRVRVNYLYLVPGL